MSIARISPEVKSQIRWAEIIPWYPRYFISDNGHVLGRRGSELSIQYDDDGYQVVSVLHPEASGRATRRLKMLRINRVVCWYFNGPFPDDGQEYHAAHLDCVRDNNWWWNLEWQTAMVNNSHPISRQRKSSSRIGRTAR